MDDWIVFCIASAMLAVGVFVGAAIGYYTATKDQHAEVRRAFLRGASLGRDEGRQDATTRYIDLIERVGDEVMTKAEIRRVQMQAPNTTLSRIVDPEVDGKSVPW